ncbi:MAG TPA: acyl-CoA dehydratase activase [Candidatus Binataceae bacterium]|nr:acyl-CoA dehydratase activase [Candidatus Binataceae bacterium]
MNITAGIDVGSTYTKAVILGADGELAARAMVNTGFRLAEAAADAFHRALAQCGLAGRDIAYVASTGFGRYQVPFRDVQVTDITAQARGARYFFPATRTVLDVGGQTMKASRLDERGKVYSFRVNDKCAAGTGAFLEKTARYMGYGVEHIGPLTSTSTNPVTISSVCAVFAESEVINHLSEGQTPADIMHGAIVSLADRGLQLMKRVKMEPEFTLLGGILRFTTMADVIRDRLKQAANVPPGDFAQYTAAIGAAILARQRLEKLRASEAAET